MIYGSIMAGLILILLLVFYKRELLIKMFSVNITSPTSQFQAQLEQTGDLVIKRLEEKIIELEYLLEEANKKMISLDYKIQAADKILDKVHNEKKDMSADLAKGNQAENRKKEITDLNIDLYRDLPREDKGKLIIEMSDLGYDITEIAQATGMSKGEIMLLLQLNKK